MWPSDWHSTAAEANAGFDAGSLERLEQLDGVAAWVFDKDLLAALPCDDLAAKTRPRRLQLGNRSVDVRNLYLKA
jgi:hypothetical protein